MMAPTAPFQAALYAEMLGRIKEDDTTVPYRRGNHFYYSRTEKGKQYPILCRKHGSLEAPEEITLDLNRLAEGHAFLALGAYAVSDDGRRLVYTVDVTGSREYTLYVKDLQTSALEPDRVERVASVAWSATPATFFYVTEDHAKRPYRLWRHPLGSVADDLLYEETDELFRLGVARARSLAYLFLYSASHTTTEVRYLRAEDPGGVWTVVAPREREHEYEVDHGGDVFYVRTNGGGRGNFPLVTAPLADPPPPRRTQPVPHPQTLMLEGVDVVTGHHRLPGREGRRRPPTGRASRSRSSAPRTRRATARARWCSRATARTGCRTP